MKTLKQTYEFSCTPADVFDALTNAAAVTAWSGGSAEAGNKEGDTFSLWDGEVHGRNLKVDPNALLVQEWRAAKDDPPGKVTFELIPHDGGTTLKLTHQDIPDEKYEDICQGWTRYYYEPIAKYLSART